ncbi:MAG TPA: hypothetical protein PKY08_00540 [Candidatus Magasanikbacteria bacterium]|nr:hypothetical protein [Candidatus Magasanikbacteria bacterium]
MRRPSPDNNNFENSSNPQETEEDIERQIAESELELYILKHAKKVNEGSNGIILKINFSEGGELPNLKKYLEKKGAKIDSEQALKILKIYSPGTGRQEFALQQQAYDILDQNQNSGLARVPKPLDFFDLQLKEETRDKIRLSGAEGVADRAEIIIMDYVPGADLATLLYRETIKRDERFVHLKNFAEEMTFEDLQEQVSQVLFYQAKTKTKDSAQRQIDEERVMDENAQILYDVLKKRGLVLHPTILSQIEKSMQLFHQNGLCFRDGHHRNFLVVGDHQASAETEPQVYVIDFGSATSFEGEFSDDLYHENGIDYADDLALVRDLKPLTTRHEEVKQQEFRDFFNNVQRNLDRLKKHPDWQKFWQEKVIPSAGREINLEELFGNIWSSLRLPLPPAEFAEVTLLAMLEEKMVTAEQVKNYLTNLLKVDPDKKRRSLPLPIQNSLIKFIKSI